MGNSVDTKQYKVQFEHFQRNVRKRSVSDLFFFAEDETKAQAYMANLAAKQGIPISDNCITQVSPEKTYRFDTSHDLDAFNERLLDEFGKSAYRPYLQTRLDHDIEKNEKISVFETPGQENRP